MGFYRAILRPLAFTLNAERAHRTTMSLFVFWLKVPGVKGYFRKRTEKSMVGLEREVFGLRFPSPVGLAAGFDKDAEWTEELALLGFGYVEIGTLTPRHQNGNPQPRLFRLKKDEALINRMGFNNGGVDKAVERLKKQNAGIPVGGNIGKNKHTPIEDAASDYLICLDKLYPVVDYFVVNVSSPNTAHLRSLQEKRPLLNLLAQLRSAMDKQPVRKPLLLKIAPDLSDEQLDEILEVCHQSGMDGLIATNTTVKREDLVTDWEDVVKIGDGGLSGQPIRERSTEVIAYLAARTKLPIIGVGGVDSPEATQEKLEAGASLVQVYTGMVYQGPALMRRINKGLRALAETQA